MPTSPFAGVPCTILLPDARCVDARRSSPSGTRSLRAAAAALLLLAVTMASPSFAQDWGRQSDDDWETQPAPPPDDGPITGWSLRAGVGFIDDPTAVLLNIEAPYVFDRWVSAGPMFQIGLDDNNTIVAPTLNVAVTIPDLPGEDFDAVHPYGFAGMGFAWIEDDNRRNDDSSAGFLVNFGFGVELQISSNFYIGSQMSFNFLPERTLGQDFFYAWQIGGARITF